MSLDTTARCPVQRRHADRPDQADTDVLIEEVPVALAYNGVSHAVMLATPSELEDLARGFSLTEGIVADRHEILDLEVHTGCEGVTVEMRIPQRRFAALKERRRNLAGRTGCGLCGLDSLSALPRVGAPAHPSPRPRPSTESIDRALGHLDDHQALFRDTGAAHGAAWVDAQGGIRLLREDVGRHNALDKLIGALLAPGTPAPPVDGFVLVTSRASYEMVQKVASAGLPALVAVSAPTAMAVRAAQTAGLVLVGFARQGRSVVYAEPSTPAGADTAATVSRALAECTADLGTP